MCCLNNKGKFLNLSLTVYSLYPANLSPEINAVKAHNKALSDQQISQPTNFSLVFYIFGAGIFF